jgi:membrane-bound lytic murein transglycosylase A
LLLGCAAPRESAVPGKPAAPPPPLRLTRESMSDLPHWNDVQAEAAMAAFRRACSVLMAKPDATLLGGAGYAGTIADWRGVCANATGNARDFFAQNFTPYAVAAGDDRDGLFTGYYEPQIRGSRIRKGKYQTPVYGVPSDLVQVDLSLFASKYKGERIAGKVANGRLVPYADRAAIETQGLKSAQTLFYTDDAIAFFFLQIQGSGRVVFDNGESGRIAYAGQNGQAYTAIGRTLIAENQLTRENVSLQSIRAWLLAHPDQAARVMRTNKSFVFFQEAPLGDLALGANGSQGTALTPLGSLAVDARIHALGAPFYVAADGDDPVHAVMVAQDTGGAIRGAVRGDMYFGFGAEAEWRAGAMKAPGRLYVLLPNALAEKIGDSAEYADAK